MAVNFCNSGDELCLFTRLPEEIVEKILCFLWLRADQNIGRLVCTLWNRLLLRIRSKRHRTFLQSVKHGKVYWRKYVNTSRVSPAPRFSHASCFLKGKLCIFGGCSSSNTVYNDLYVFCLAEQKWSKVTTSGFTPAPRECATLVSYRSKDSCTVVLFGGCCQPPRSLMPLNGKFFNDVQILNFVDKNWTAIHGDESYPCPRAGHSASVIGNTMVIFGGAQSEKRLEKFTVTGVLSGKFGNCFQDFKNSLKVYNQIWEASTVRSTCHEKHQFSYPPTHPKKFSQLLARKNNIAFNIIYVTCILNILHYLMYII